MPVLFGAATILLLPLLSAGIGRTAVVTAAMLMALSPAMVFYSRMYIQEALFACFALAFVIGVGRVATGGGLAWAAMTGVAAGLAMATKETAAIVLPSAVAAAAIAWWSVGAGRPPERAARQARAEGDPGGPGRRSGSRGALLFVVPDRAWCDGRTLPAAQAPTSPAGSTRRSRAALVLLPAAAHLLRVRRPALE